MQPTSRHWLKFVLGWAVCFAIRLLPFRPPNIEPILTTTMPFGRHFGMLGGFTFGFVSIALFDMAVGQVGSWTWMTAVCYGLLGAGAALYFNRRKGTPVQYLTYAIIGTLLYNAFTGLTLGPLLWDQPFMEALGGQIPFTAWHLAGNAVFAVTLSPLIDRWVAGNAKLEHLSLLKRKTA